MTIDRAVTEEGMSASDSVGAALFDVGKAITLANGRLWPLPHKGQYAFYTLRNGNLQRVASLALEKGRPWNGRLTYLIACNGQEIPEPTDLSGTTDEIAVRIIDLLKTYL